MTPEIIYCEQQSEEWFQARLGIVTASRFSEVLNKSSGRKTYMMKLLAEKMTEEPEYSYHNRYMDEGIEKEPDARIYYEKLRKVKVEQVGFIKNCDVGASPDGLIGEDGTIEIKCPLPSTHLGYILKDELPSIYKPQIQGILWISGRQWCDFISFAPTVKNCRPFWYIRIERDENYIRELKKAVEQFVFELKSLVQKLEIPF